LLKRQMAPGFLSVALVFQHAKLARRFILPSVTCPALPYFAIYGLSPSAIFCHLWPIPLCHILPSMACPALPYFAIYGLTRSAIFCHLWPVPLCHILPHYLLNGAIFGKCLLNIKCFFLFSLQGLSETFLVLRRIQRYITLNLHGLHAKCPLFLSRFNGT
jgi:hypothetical protein